MIVNINYMGEILEITSQFKFGSWKPRQYVYKCKDYSIIVFRSGKCRIMGCKKELDLSTLPFKIHVEKVQSVTSCVNLGFNGNLNQLTFKLSQQCIFEPEFFTGLRYIKFNHLREYI